ncbi:SH3 domain-containing protein [Arenibaculum pallidiluteum]|uniref:SH3 domain-containing protein n=1 Tax=Arenibaculum pallidiluteum TaxID=2812559 RepID=UPI001A95E22E|nr:SH3 domain-containing protein [Arenibaculum pallidiluteum]
MAKNRRLSLGAVLGLAAGLAGCGTSAPPPPLAAPAPEPEGIAVLIHTDPVTGRQDGPFDIETGMRILTETGADGVIRVVRDPISKTPVLLSEQKARTVPAVPAPTPAAVRLKTAANIRSGPGTNFAILTALPALAAVTPTGSARSGWTEYRAQAPTGQAVTGWIADSLVSTAP